MTIRTNVFVLVFALVGTILLLVVIDFRRRNVTCLCETPKQEEKYTPSYDLQINENHDVKYEPNTNFDVISHNSPRHSSTVTWAVRYMTSDSAKEFMRLIYHLNVFQKPRFYCNSFRRVGSQLPKDGGWFVCFDDKIRPTDSNQQCIVYSFGIGLPDHKHSEQVWFYNTGLDAYNSDDVIRTLKGQQQHWKMRSFDEILKENGHTNRIIDYLKLDIEKSEYATIPQMLQTGSLENVKQLAFEFHIFAIGNDNEEEMYNAINENILKALKTRGFLLWHIHEVPYSRR
uniref:Uncharacterized protein LOC102805592 n=1 Tax=Saccoglossus kowalevskii TaxID=10224 RepID=A0ABM0LX11_SACKO